MTAKGQFKCKCHGLRQQYRVPLSCGVGECYDGGPPHHPYRKNWPQETGRVSGEPQRREHPSSPQQPVSPKDWWEHFQAEARDIKERFLWDHLYWSVFVSQSHRLEPISLCKLAKHSHWNGARSAAKTTRAETKAWGKTPLIQSSQTLPVKQDCHQIYQGPQLICLFSFFFFIIIFQSWLMKDWVQTPLPHLSLNSQQNDGTNSEEQY